MKSIQLSEVETRLHHQDRLLHVFNGGNFCRGDVVKVMDGYTAGNVSTSRDKYLVNGVELLQFSYYVQSSVLFMYGQGHKLLNKDIQAKLMANSGYSSIEDMIRPFMPALSIDDGVIHFHIQVVHFSMFRYTALA